MRGIKIRPSHRKYFTGAKKEAKKWGLEGEFKMFYKKHRKQKAKINQAITNALADWDIL